MKAFSRRRFLASSLAGAAGMSLIPANSFARTEVRPLFPGISSGSVEDETFWNFVQKHFAFRPGLYYFNNASLGPSPEYVIDATEKHRRELDSFPSHYMWGGWRERVEQVREGLAAHLGAEAEEIALIHNTTEGMNVFARSFDLRPGDEVILADHEHRVGTVPWQYYQEPLGIRIVRPVLPVVPRSKDDLLQAYIRAVTPKTKIISLVHMTNTNGMILPLKEITEMAHSKGIMVCVDGAQSVGMFRFNLHETGCDFYTASSHKWLFAPKGTGFLYARKERIGELKPLYLNRHFEKEDIRMFEAYNTRNLPDVLGLGAALQYHELLGGGLKESRIYYLKKYFLEQIAGDSRFICKTPADDQLSAGIQAVEVEGLKVGAVRDKLFEQYGIDCRPMYSHDLNALRISLSVFNTLKDIDYLLTALRTIADAPRG